MSLDFILPGLAVLVLAATVGLVPWRIPPMALVWMLTAVAAVAAATMAVVVVLVVASFGSQLPIASSVLERFGFVANQHAVGVAEGAASVVVAVTIVIRVARVARLRRGVGADTSGRHFAVLESPEPIAYAAPGRPGCVVVSRGLLNVLSPRERRVVVAHERAHLRLGHHRHLTLGELSLGVVPILAPLVHQLRLATERSADESAVRALGGDRQVVASTIARAAVATSAFHQLVGSFGGSSVPLRVEALLSPPVLHRSRWNAVATVTVLLLIGAFAAQAHHLYLAISHMWGF